MAGIQLAQQLVAFGHEALAVDDRLQRAFENVSVKL
jgi:hypothetical protein